MENRKLGERIRAARERSGLSQAALGRLFGISREAVAQWESGRNAPTADKLGRLAAETKVNVEWLMTGAGTMEMAERPPQVQIETSFSRNVPIHEGPLCGEDDSFDFESQAAVDFAPRPPRLVNVYGAYAIYIRGDSMEPWREPGQIVYVNPTQPPKLNDYVVIQVKPKVHGALAAAYIKRLVSQNGKEIRLLQYNPRKYLTFSRTQIVLIHRIMDWSELIAV